MKNMLHSILWTITTISSILARVSWSTLIKEFASFYPEMIRFELYIPDGWTGAYKNFLAEVPQEERYWMVDGRDLFERKA